MKFVLASNNMGKIKEIKNLLKDLGAEVISQREAGADIDVDETGSTFEENAMLKARESMKITNLPTIADDSGLCVEALGGEPGIYSARYTGNHGDSDEDRYNYLLEKMKGIEDRNAKFVCCICCVFPNGDTITARGECPGIILHQPKGSGGFGYDPVFQPEGYEVSMAELGEEKNRISHRARALEILKTELENYQNGINK